MTDEHFNCVTLRPRREEQAVPYPDCAPALLDAIMSDTGISQPPPWVHQLSGDAPLEPMVVPTPKRDERWEDERNRDTSVTMRRRKEQA